MSPNARFSRGPYGTRSRLGCWIWSAMVVLTMACVATPLAEAAAPAVSYALHCRGCHLADGRETPDLVPALKGSVGRFVQLPEGRTYLIRLPNIASTPLTDQETAELLTWVVREFGGTDVPPGFVPFTAEEIGRSRPDPLLDVEGTRRELIAKLDEIDARSTAGVQAGPAAVAPAGGQPSSPRPADATTRTGGP